MQVKLDPGQHRSHRLKFFRLSSVCHPCGLPTMRRLFNGNHIGDGLSFNVQQPLSRVDPARRIGHRAASLLSLACARDARRNHAAMAGGCDLFLERFAARLCVPQNDVRQAVRLPVDNSTASMMCDQSSALLKLGSTLRRRGADDLHVRFGRCGEERLR